MTSIKKPASTLRITDSAELIEAIPYLLGFHPHESLVVIGLARGTSHERLQVRVATRVDIPPHPVRTGDFNDLIGALRNSDAEALILVWLTELAGSIPGENPLIAQLTGTLVSDAIEAGHEIVDVLVATCDRWWSLSCEDQQCCPAQGRPRSAGTAVVSAQATYAGLVALPDRDALGRQLLGLALSAREKLRGPILRSIAETADHSDLSGGFAGPQTSDPVVPGRRFAAAVAAFIAAADLARGTSTAPTIADHVVVEHAVSLQTIAIRDELWMLIDDGGLDAAALLSELHTRLPSPFDAPALFLFGWSCWRRGDGTLATMAAERALDSDPNYTAAELLLKTVQLGLDPRSTPSLHRVRRAPRSGQRG